MKTQCTEIHDTKLGMSPFEQLRPRELTSSDKLEIEPNPTLLMICCFYKYSSKHNSGVSVFSIACTLFCCQCLVKVPGKSYKIRLQAVLALLVKCLLKLIYQREKDGCEWLLRLHSPFPSFFLLPSKWRPSDHSDCYLSLGQKNILFSMTLSKHSHYPSK